MKKLIKQEQWVMLPTEDKSPFSKWIDGKLYKHDYVSTSDDGGKNQHLYLVSENIATATQIMEGTLTALNLFIGEDGDYYLYVKFENDDRKYFRKVIATTESGKPFTDRDIQVKLAWIPESFIKYYVKKQGRVGDIEIESESELVGSLWTSYVRNQIKITETNEIIIDIPKETRKVPTIETFENWKEMAMKSDKSKTLQIEALQDRLVKSEKENERMNKALCDNFIIRILRDTKTNAEWRRLIKTGLIKKEKK